MVIGAIAKNKVGKWGMKCSVKEGKGLEGIRKVMRGGPIERGHVSKDWIAMEEQAMWPSGNISDTQWTCVWSHVSQGERMKRWRGAKSNEDGCRSPLIDGLEEHDAQYWVLASHGSYSGLPLTEVGPHWRAVSKRMTCLGLDITMTTMMRENLEKDNSRTEKPLNAHDCQADLFICPFLMKILSICFLPWQKQKCTYPVFLRETRLQIPKHLCMWRVILATQPRLPLGINALWELLNCIQLKSM